LQYGTFAQAFVLFDCSVQAPAVGSQRVRTRALSNGRKSVQKDYQGQ